MIESLTLKDFRCHKRLTLEFDRRVTVLAGPTGRGKSCVLQALRWIFYNQPRGDSVIGSWGKAPYAKASAVIDGHEVVRKLGKKNNLYRLDNEPLKAFGTGVPKQIADLLNVGEINYQGQIDLPFWFTLSAPQVSRNLNEIVNLGAIDQSLANVAAKVRKQRSVREVSSERLASAQTTLKKLKFVKKFDAALREVEAADAEVTSLFNTEHELRSLIEGMAEAASRQKKLAQQATALGNLLASATDRLKEATAKQEALALEVRQLSSLHLAIGNLEFEVKEADESISKIRKKLSKFKDRCPLCRQKVADPQVFSLVTFTPPSDPRVPEERTRPSGL